VCNLWLALEITSVNVEEDDLWQGSIGYQTHLKSEPLALGYNTITLG
jgi:hypothetical protein